MSWNNTSWQSCGGTSSGSSGSSRQRLPSSSNSSYSLDNFHSTLRSSLPSTTQLSDVSSSSFYPAQSPYSSTASIPTLLWSTAESSSSSSSSNSIDRLSDECLAAIFERLPVVVRIELVEKVCKRWKKVGAEKSWSNQKYFDNFWLKRMTNFRMISRVFYRSGQFLEQLSLSRLKSAEVRELLPLCPSVVHLRLVDINLDPETLLLIHARMGRQLVSLHFENCLQGCRDLKKDCCVAQPGFSNALNRLFADATALQYLTIKERRPQFTQPALFTRLPRCLKFLRIDDKHCSFTNFLLRSPPLEVLREQKTGSNTNVTLQLGNLLAIQVNNLSSRTVFEFIAQHPQLTHLSVKLTSVAEQIFIATLRTLPSLRSIELVGDVTMNALQGVAAKVPYLEHLTLALNSSIISSGDDKTSLVKSLVSMSRLKSLHTLGYHEQQSAAVLALAEAHGRLEYLHMDDRGSLRVGEVCRLLRSCKNFRVLNAYCNFKGTEGAMEMISNSIILHPPHTGTRPQYIYFKHVGKSFCQHLDEAAAAAAARATTLVFTAKLPPSPTLREHKYGVPSGDIPPWEEKCEK